MATSQSTRRGHRFKDITGAKFGRLFVLGVAGKKKGSYVWACVCDCGNFCTATVTAMTTDRKQSCGCIWRETFHHTTHGGSATPTYRIYVGVMQRCFRSYDQRHKDYGGRGITVCERWRESFADFLSDMGEKPSQYHSIDRIEVDGNYSCGHCSECIRNGWTANCRWATMDEQALNKRTTKYIEFNGERKPLIEWCEIMGMDRSIVAARLRVLGWSVEKALTTPARVLPKRSIPKTQKSV